MDKQNCQKGVFVRFAEEAAYLTGHPAAFLTAAAVVIVWGFSGSVFHYSNTWQLVINTGTTIVTFLMVFLIQNMQNRDTKALHLKLDELIRATEGAHTSLLGLDDMSDADLRALHDKYQKLAAAARARIDAGGDDTDIPEFALEKAEAAKTGV